MPQDADPETLRAEQERGAAVPAAAGDTVTRAPSTIAVVDMGSNSFRLEVARVDETGIHHLDTWRETLRMGASMDARGMIQPAYERAMLACLARFGERLRGLHPSTVRAVATNTFRVARNARRVLARAEKVLGLRIDVVSGLEEARLIYLGVAYLLPASEAPRLVIDIGGGSTEFVIGTGMQPQALESLQMGCVGYSQRYFAGGRTTRAAFDRAATAAAAEVEAIARDFDANHWRDAFGSSGTAQALADIGVHSGFATSGITRESLEALRQRMIRAGSVERLALPGLKASRAPVLAGGLAIMLAAMEGLRIERVEPAVGALRLGVMVDMLGPGGPTGTREATIAAFVARHHVDAAHAQRVADLARALYLAAAPRPDAETAKRVHWAGMLHEIGQSISHQGFHKHGAYILENADMPGFSASEQRALAWLVTGCRGNLAKLEAILGDAGVRAQLVALRIAVIVHHARMAVDVPEMALAVRDTIRLSLPRRWLDRHPLTAHLLREEGEAWTAQGYRFFLRDLTRYRAKARP